MPSPELADLADLAGRRYGAAAAQRWPTTDGWRSRSFAELADVVQRVAAVLSGLGVRPGDPGRAAVPDPAGVDEHFAELVEGLYRRPD